MHFSTNIVTTKWLEACINSKRIADPKEFLYQLQASHFDSVQTVPSPSSKQNVEAMNPSPRRKDPNVLSTSPRNGANVLSPSPSSNGANMLNPTPRRNKLNPTEAIKIDSQAK